MDYKETYRVALFSIFCIAILAIVGFIFIIKDGLAPVATGSQAVSASDGNIAGQASSRSLPSDPADVDYWDNKRREGITDMYK